MMYKYLQQGIIIITMISGISAILAVHEKVSGFTGNEIALNLTSAEFIPQNDTGDFQIKLNLNYSVSDSSLIGQKLNAVMKVHSPDGSVIKTSSFPTGFTANSTGTAEMLTNIPKSVAQNITTETVFTDLNKTNVLSNTVETPPHIDKIIQSSDMMPTVIANSS
jgi:hypothetical protein